MERWERRAAKLESRKRQMGVSGRSLKTVILPIIAKRAYEARAVEQRDARRKHTSRSVPLAV
jgi:hypothetical protein